MRVLQHCEQSILISSVSRSTLTIHRGPHDHAIPAISYYARGSSKMAAMQDVPTVLIARTDADSATLLTSDIDDADKAFCTGERTPEGFFKVRSGVEVRR